MPAGTCATTVSANPRYPTSSHMPTFSADMAQTLTRYTAQRYLQSWCVLRAAMMFQGVRKLGICGLRLHEAHQGPFRKTLQLQMSAGRSRSNASATSAFANRIPASYGPQLTRRQWRYKLHPKSPDTWTPLLKHLSMFSADAYDRFKPPPPPPPPPSLTTRCILCTRDSKPQPHLT
jgi:hypothetical protein